MAARQQEHDRAADGTRRFGRGYRPDLRQPLAQEDEDLGLDPDWIRPTPLVEPEGAATAWCALDPHGCGAAHDRDPDRAWRAWASQ